jgi:two-component system response regulator AtoC
LVRNGGNRVKTAQDLGISRRSLLYKIQEHGIG